MSLQVVNSPVKTAVTASTCESYSISDLKRHRGKRRRTLPAIRKQTTAALLTALADGDLKTAQLLLDSSLSVITTDRLGRSALHLATCLPPKRSAIQICQTLLQKQCDVNQGDLFGMSPFVYAVSSQNLTMFSSMLASAKVDKLDKFGNTSLHHAVASGNIVMVRTIAEKTQKINKVNILGFTPLMITSKLGYVDCAKLLTQHGAFSGSIRDMHFYLTADEWARFSRRFTQQDLNELKQAERHYRNQARNSSLLRSDHPDCQTAACEVYRTTSRTLPIYVKGNEQDQNNQTQLMIKRVILLRKLSEFFSSTGKKLQINHNLDSNNINVREKSSGNIKSISVNDLLDQHLSKLTLGSTVSRQRQRRKVNKTQFARSDLDSAGSVDSILIRQAQAIEKGNMVRKKEAVKSSQNTCALTRRPQLEPSIVTLVHVPSPRAPVQTPRSFRSTRSSMASPVQKFVNIVQEPRDVVTPDQLAGNEVLIPDCTTVDSVFVKQTTDEDEYESKEANPPLLCEKVRYSQLRNKQTPGRVGENPTGQTRTRTSLLPQYTLAKRRKQSSQAKIKADHKELMKGFGPWVTESEAERICSLPRSRPPSLP